MIKFSMLCRFLFWGSCFVFLTAAAPPPFLAMYIHNDNFDAGDHAFLRGAFSGASIQQIANWKALQAYTNLCMRDSAHLESNELRKIGVNAQVDENRGYQDHLCTQIVFASAIPKDFKTWDDFQGAWARSQPYFQTYKSAVEMAVRSLNSNPEKDTFEEQLTSHTVPDQMWRSLVMGAALSGVSNLDAAARSALRMQSISEGTNVDWINSHWARHILEAQGWSPAIKAGRKSAMLMWLLVQHADEDPVFQVMALRKLEPLAKAGLFSKQNYALLFDRVMIATTGKQHYGSQLSCRNHQLAPSPLDTDGNNPRILDARRSDMNLPPEASYIERFEKSFPKGC